MPPETFARSLWSAIAPPALGAPALEGEARADIAIVGAGILGLSTALHLAEAGVAVAVVEAREAGWGASGRSGGLVVPHYARIDPATARRRLGDERGDRLSTMLGSGGDLVFELVRRHAIACSDAQAGWLCPAHAPSRLVALEDRARQWQALGRPIDIIDAAETERLTGAPGYLGALLDPTGGHLDPLAYTRGLARAAVAAGARLYEGSPVSAIRREGGRWHLDTPGGRLSAEQVLLATNAGPATPALPRCTIPLNVYQSATAPLSEAERRHILPEGHALSDTRADLFSVRPAPGQRLVTGGMAAIQAGAFDRIQDRMAARLRRRLPALRTAGFEYRWHGVATLTPDFLPRLWRIGPGALAAAACNGRGIAMATALGRALARHLAGALGEAELPVPVTDPEPLRFPRLSALLPGALLPLGRLQDRFWG